MPLIRPFKALRPKPEFADQVLAPPYDVVTSAQAKKIAAGKTWNFLHISRPEIDLPETLDIHSAEVYQQGAKQWQKMLEQNILQQDTQPAYYVYKIINKHRQQTGLVAAVSLAAYRQGDVRKHELTRPDKENDRAQHIAALNAQTGPALLTYKADANIKLLFDEITKNPPELNITMSDGVIHQLWQVNHEKLISQFSEQFSKINRFYIADGHHRSAAAARVAEARGVAEDQAHLANHFLAVLFPHDELFILGYHRVLRDLNNHSPQLLLTELNKIAECKLSSDIIEPNKPYHWGLYLNKQWYELRLRDEIIQKNNDPLSRLDVSLLTNCVLTPLFNIQDVRRDSRLEFVGGHEGIKSIISAVDSGAMAVGFVLPATQMTDLLAVADRNEIMPPKSTWFDPKLADGLVSYSFE